MLVALHQLRLGWQDKHMCRKQTGLWLVHYIGPVAARYNNVRRDIAQQCRDALCQIWTAHPLRVHGTQMCKTQCRANFNLK
jgi:hypothetical protein